VLLCLGAAALRAGDVEVGRMLLEQGNVREAREYITRAYQSDSASIEHCFAHALLITNAGNAQKAYTNIAENKSADAALRCRAYMRLGALSYARYDYENAYMMYARGWELDPNAECGRLLARAAISKQDLIVAEALLAPASNAEYSPYYMANVSFLKDDYDQALAGYDKTARVDSGNYRAPALAQAIVCCSKLEKAEEKMQYRKTLNKRFDFILEEALLDTDTGNCAPPKPAADDKHDAAKKAQTRADRKKAFYSLQVGAFASLENARAMRRRLIDDYKDVIIAPAIVRGRNLHRVRIGSFESEKKAEIWARRHLKRKGISYRVVPK
jgi:tetratricopeptide (TPR) repeat protein